MSFFNNVLNTLGFGSSTNTSGTGSTTPIITNNQQQTLDAQTQAFLNSFLPQYLNATGNATGVYNASNPYINNASLQGYNTSLANQNDLTAGGKSALYTASNNLKNLTSPDYFNQLLNGALGSVADVNRESMNTNNAMYGGSGQLGSARSVLANANTSSINQARNAAAISGALSNFTGQAIQGAGTLGQLGQGAVASGAAAGQNAVNFAGAPMNLASAYANILYGTPNALPNFAGTQGSTNSGASGSTSYG